MPSFTFYIFFIIEVLEETLQSMGPNTLLQPFCYYQQFAFIKAFIFGQQAVSIQQMCMFMLTNISDIMNKSVVS